MENQKINPFKLAMTYGIYLAGISIVLALIIWATSLMEVLGLFGSFFLGILQLIILVLLLIYFTKQYRNNELDGKITFSQAFAFGIMIVVFSSIISSLYSYIFNKYIDPEYAQRIMTMIQEKTYAMMSNQGLSEEQIDSAMVKFENKEVPTPMKTLGSSLISGLIGGTIMSLISSAIVKKNVSRENDFDEAMEEVKTEE